MEVLLARKDQIIKISGLMNSEGKKYFNMDFLVDRWLGVKGQDLLDNVKAKKKAAEEKKKAEEEGGEEGGGSTESGDSGEFKL